ncbi:alcohol oxidase [Gigaspora margarita]|uniref:Alcohol oxidase n=1 Tax=Gigaspora margarita TaxID=4874 RepID=A0A8H4AVI4_GIGMA|nr:alcohol oxidase [Gigaspora margarita]
MKNICNYNKHAKFKIKETYDFIIVGAGTAGCMLAKKLIHGISNIKILVLEARGPNVHANGLISLPCTWFKARSSEQYNDWAAQGPEYKI